MSINTTHFIANSHKSPLGDSFTNFTLLQNLPKLESNISIIDCYTELLLKSRCIEKTDCVGQWIHSTLLLSALGFKDSEIKMKTADFNLPSMVKNFGLENTFCLLTQAYRMSHQVAEFHGEYQSEAVIAKKFFYQQLQMLAKRHPTPYVNFLKQFAAGKIVALDRASVDPKFIEKLQKNNGSLTWKIATIAIGLITLSGLTALAARTVFSETPASADNVSNNGVHQPTHPTTHVNLPVQKEIFNLPVQKEIFTINPHPVVSTAQTFQEYMLELKSKRPYNESLSTISLTSPILLNNKLKSSVQDLTNLKDVDSSDLEEADSSENSQGLYSVITKIIAAALATGGLVTCFRSRRKKETNQESITGSDQPQFLITKKTDNQTDNQDDEEDVDSLETGKENEGTSRTGQEEPSTEDFDPFKVSVKRKNDSLDRNDSNLDTVGSNPNADNPYGISFLDQGASADPMENTSPKAVLPNGEEEPSKDTEINIKSGNPNNPRLSWLVNTDYSKLIEKLSTFGRKSLALSPWPGNSALPPQLPPPEE